MTIHANFCESSCNSFRFRIFDSQRGYPNLVILLMHHHYIFIYLLAQTYIHTLNLSLSDFFFINHHN